MQQIGEDLGITHGLIYKWRRDAEQAGEDRFPGLITALSQQPIVRSTENELPSFFLDSVKKAAKVGLAS